MSAADPVAIVGIGAVYPGAGDAPTLWANILAGVDSVTEVPTERWDQSTYYDPEAYHRPPTADRFYCRRGGFVDDVASFDPTRFGIMPAVVASTDPDQLLALRAAAEAIDDAGGADRLPDATRVGVIIGRGGYLTPGMARLDQRVRTVTQLVASLRDLVPGLTEAQLAGVRTGFLERLGPERPDASIGLVPNFAASRIANRFDLRGPSYTVDAACASGLVAVDAAVRELHTGRCDTVLAGAVHVCHDPTLWSVFTQLRALSPSERIRPFDRRADGTLMGEGTGIVVLKRLADAERDGDRVYAVIRGVGVASDGKATSLVSPYADGQVLAVQRAWAAAGLDPTVPDALGLVEAHGTATPVGDEVELTTLARVFGGPGSGPPIGLGTVKSMIGHAMPAASMAGMIKAALAVHHGVLPPTLHVEEPHPGFAATRCRPVAEAVEWRAPGPRRAGVNAFGFGGINAHLVLEQVPAAAAVEPLPALRRVRAGAAPVAATVAVTVAAQAAAPPQPAAATSGRAGEAVAVAGEAGRPGLPADAAEPVLLLTADTARGLAAQLASADATLLARARVGGEPDADGPYRLAIVAPTQRRLALARKVVERGRPWRGREDLWFTPRPLLAGEDAGRLAFLFPGFEPEFRPRVDDVAAQLGLAPPELTGDDELQARGKDVVAVGRLLAAALAELGVRPDLVAGHSLGEWTAMVVAGCFRGEAVDAFVASLRPGEVDVPDVVYAALGCGAERAGTVAGGDVVVSHDNCPHQSVLCGPPGPVAAALDRLRAEGVPGELMPFRSGFHTPMAGAYLAAVRASFEVLPLSRPRVPIWSATTLGPFPTEPTGVRELIVRHLLEPVRFRPLLERLHDAEVRAFVQVGPGSLTGFVTDTLGRQEHLTIAAQAPNRGGLAQLRRVLAALWVEGRRPHWDRLPAPVAADPQAPATPARTGPSPRIGAARPGPARVGAAPVRLALGAPTVRMLGAPPMVAPPAAVPVGHAPAGQAPAALTPPAGGHPVLAELAGLLTEAGSAADAVVRAWTTAPPAAVPARAPAVPTPPPAAADRSVTTVDCSLAAMPYLLDHSLVQQPPDWADPDDRFPVVPMTGLLELMADAARRLLPGRTVVALTQVRALRWLAVSPPTRATLRAVVEGPDRVRVTIDGYCGGTVLLADGYPPPPDPDDASLRDEGSAPVTAAELYADNWMFHGPQFAGIAAIDSVAADGIRGVLTALPAPGALLDAAGQLIGHWMQVSADVDQVVFPIGIEAVRFFAPPPAAGAELVCTARITELTDERMAADAQLRDADGRVRITLTGWATHRFSTDDRMWALKQSPGTVGAGELQPEGWTLVRERWPDTATRELVMRRYLNGAERAEYAGMSPLAQRQWIMGRVAVKDAVRELLWRGGADRLYPGQVTVGNDEAGRPWARGPAGEAYAVSLAHSGAVAVALAVPGDAAVGIDVEPVVERGPAVVDTALAPAERELLDRLPGADRAEALTRLWTAKEAVAKALGGGLAGRPRAFVVTGANAAGCTVEPPGGGAYRVHQRRIDGPDQRYVVAWTTSDDRGGTG